jgi:hypothetical protein
LSSMWVKPAFIGSACYHALSWAEKRSMHQGLKPPRTALRSCWAVILREIRKLRARQSTLDAFFKEEDVPQSDPYSRQ